MRPSCSGGRLSPARTARLDRAQVQADLDLLVAGLDRAYSGKDHLPAGEYDRLLSRLAALRESFEPAVSGSAGDLLCQRLTEIFWDVPDNHLYTFGPYRRQLRPHAANVGRNVARGTGYTLQTRQVKGRRVGILSLGTSMPAKDDACWKGFEETVDRACRETDALVLDLRNNGGGMSDDLRWLASRLYGNPARMANEIIHLRESSAADALLSNEATLDILEAREEGRPVQSYLLQNQERCRARAHAREGKAPAWSKDVRRGSEASFDPAKGYPKPLRVLIDRGTASAAEGGYARFLSHPFVKTYGDNTGGYIHYGDTEPLVLPNSHVVVSIPVSYREFSDGRFLEKIGYAPDVRVPDGQDALEAALEDLAQIP